MTTIYKPNLYSTAMVIAIMEDRKSMTRRMNGLEKVNKNPDLFGLGNVIINGYFNFYDKKTEKGLMIRPRYLKGDILWVRETFEFFAADWNPHEDDLEISSTVIFNYKASNRECLNEVNVKNVLGYKALTAINNQEGWKPSIHMPKEAARIFLEVTNVKCERLQNISEEDAIAEGIEKYGPFGEFKGSRHPSGGMMKYRAYSKASRAFQDIWMDIYGEKSWKQNPWVWVYEFKKVEKPQNWPL